MYMYLESSLQTQRGGMARLGYQFVLCVYGSTHCYSNYGFGCKSMAWWAY